MATKYSLIDNSPLMEDIISRKSKENPARAISFQFKKLEWIETPRWARWGSN